MPPVPPHEYARQGQAQRDAVQSIRSISRLWLCSIVSWDAGVIAGHPALGDGDLVPAVSCPGLGRNGVEHGLPVNAGACRRLSSSSAGRPGDACTSSLMGPCERQQHRRAGAAARGAPAQRSKRQHGAAWSRTMTHDDGQSEPRLARLGQGNSQAEQHGQGREDHGADALGFERSSRRPPGPSAAAMPDGSVAPDWRKRRPPS